MKFSSLGIPPYWPIKPQRHKAPGGAGGTSRRMARKTETKPGAQTQLASSRRVAAWNLINRLHVNQIEGKREKQQQQLQQQQLGAAMLIQIVEKVWGILAIMLRLISHAPWH